MESGAGDFLRIVRTLNLSPSERRRLAPMLGFDEPDINAWSPTPSTNEPQERAAESSSPLSESSEQQKRGYVSVPFFRAEFVWFDEIDDAQPTPDTGLDPFTLKDFAPLEQLRGLQTPPHTTWSAQWPIIFDLIAETRPSAAIDTKALVARAARLKPIQDVPRQPRRHWPQKLTILRDRSKHLLPVWSDQNRLVDHLQKIIGDANCEVIDLFTPLGGGQLAVVGEQARTCLALTDLGFYGSAVHRSKWSAEAERRIDAGQWCKALLPVAESRWSRASSRWRRAAWSARSTWQSHIDQEERAAHVHALLTFLAPAHRIEFGLIRALRQALGIQGDLSTDFDVWLSPALNTGHSLAASWVPQVAERFRAHYIEPSQAKEKATAVRILRQWHQPDFGRDVWRAEVQTLRAMLQDAPPELCDRIESVLEELNAPDDFGERFFATMLNGHAFDKAALAPFLRALSKEAPQLFERGYRAERDNKGYNPWFEALNLAPAPVSGSAPVGRGLRARDLRQRGEVDGTRRITWRHTHEGVAPTEQGSLLYTDDVTANAYAVEYRGVDAKYTYSSKQRSSITPQALLQAEVNAPWATRSGRDDFGSWAEVDIDAATFRMRWIGPGTFLMGSPEDEPGRYDDEGPQHEVTLSEGFWMADTPCTQELYEAVTGENPSTYQSPGRPVETVSWEDARSFLKALNARMPGLNLSLPTEAQWEYACRAGTTTATYAGALEILGANNAPGLDDIAWYGGNSGVGFDLKEGYDCSDWGEKQYPHTVAGTRLVQQKQPNAWGLYDTLGNVYEWCQDWHAPYSSESRRDPTGPSEGEDRVIRGGSWDAVARNCRAANRYANEPSYRLHSLGFRFCRGQVAPGGGPEGLEEKTGDGRSPSGAVPGQDDTPSILVRRSGLERRPEWANYLRRDDWGTYADVVLPVRRSAPEVSFRLRLIPSGEFMMGSPDDEEGRWDDEGPQHLVTLTQAFWMADTPCTQAVYEAVLGQNPSGFKGAQHPVEQVSWTDTQTFLEALNDRIPKLNLALPTEAQWEYACRAGTTSARYGELDAVAWYHENSGSRTHPVQQKQPNAWGLYDTLGNVLEWCQDWHALYSNEAQQDPTGPSEGGSRVFRGGSWDAFARNCRAAYRGARVPSLRNRNLGFRFCRGQAAPGGGPEGPGEGRAEPGQEDRGAVWSDETKPQAPSGPYLILKTDRSELALGVVERPAWADAMGRDAFGLFIDTSVSARRKSMFDVSFRMRWMPPGRFFMGSPEKEAGRFDDETLHSVTLSEGFWLADTPCTQALWTAVMTENPSYFKSPDRPVETVSFEDVQQFLQQLRQQKPSLALALPTEAQWEYACRASTQTATYAGDLVIAGDRNAPLLDAIAWYGGNSGVDFDLETGGYDSSDWPEKQYPHTVAGTRIIGIRRPNPWGLYDMLGNVYEWCQDWLGDYNSEAQQDPTGPSGGELRVLRGGSWNADARSCRAAYRDASEPSDRNPYLGFRFCRGQVAPGGGPEGPGESVIEGGGRSPSGAVPLVPEQPEAAEAARPSLFTRVRRWLSGKDTE